MSIIETTIQIDNRPILVINHEEFAAGRQNRDHHYLIPNKEFAPFWEAQIKAAYGLDKWNPECPDDDPAWIFDPSGAYFFRADLFPELKNADLPEFWSSRM